MLSLVSVQDGSGIQNKLDSSVPALCMSSLELHRGQALVQSLFLLESRGIPPSAIPCHESPIVGNTVDAVQLSNRGGTNRMLRTNRSIHV